MVQKLASGKYRAQVRVGAEVKGGVFSRKKDAEAAERKYKIEQELTRKGLELPSEEILLLDYTQKWLVRREKKAEIGAEITWGTYSMDESRLRNHVLPSLGTRPLAAIATLEVQSFLDEIQEEKELANATRNRIRAVMHTLFQDAFMEGKILINPVTRAELLPENPERAKPLTIEQANKLILSAYGKNQNLGFCTEVMIFQGARISQAVAIKNLDFNLKTDELTFQRMFEQSTGVIRNRIKGRPKGLVMPLFPRVKAALLKHLRATNKSDSDDFLISYENGISLSTCAIRNQLYHLCDNLKIPRITPHVLRATFATLAEEAGFSKEDNQRMLGHSTITVTERYTRRDAQPLVEKGKKLGFGLINESRGKNVSNLRRRK